MSTFSQNVQKVKDAFEKIKTALTGKGVTVPDGAKLSDVPALVDGISTGTPALCTFELTYSDGTKTVETTSEGVVRLHQRMSEYSRDVTDVASRLTGVSIVADQDTKYGSADDMCTGCEQLRSVSLPTGFCNGSGSVVGMFSYCSALESLTLPEGFGVGATSARHMFLSCSMLASLHISDGFCVGENGLVRADGMFYACASLTSLKLPAGFGQCISNAEEMFMYCSSLTSLTLPAGFGGQVASTGDMFCECSALEHIVPLDPDLEIGEDGTNGVLCIPVSFSLSDSPLDADSVAVVIKSLPAVESAQTLTLSSTAYAHVTDALRGVANTKNWTVESA